MIVDIDLSGWRIADHKWLIFPANQVAERVLFATNKFVFIFDYRGCKQSCCNMGIPFAPAM